MDCIFCKIASGDIPADKLYEDDRVVAFNDLSPQAPVHFLVIPKNHVQSAAELTGEHAADIGRVFEVIARLARERGLENGFRVITNSGVDASQSVKHLHFHVLGGKKLTESLA